MSGNQFKIDIPYSTPPHGSSKKSWEANFQIGDWYGPRRTYPGISKRLKSGPSKRSRAAISRGPRQGFYVYKPLTRMLIDKTWPGVSSRMKARPDSGNHYENRSEHPGISKRLKTRPSKRTGAATFRGPRQQSYLYKPPISQTNVREWLVEHGLPESNTGAGSIGVPGWPRLNMTNWNWNLNSIKIKYLFCQSMLIAMLSM